MSHRILLTGASGYLGGDLLPHLNSQNLPTYDKLYALVRTDAQAHAVKEHGAEPISFNLKDEKAVRDAIVGNAITIVFYLIDSGNYEDQVCMIKALAEVKKKVGGEVHLLHVGSHPHSVNCSMNELGGREANCAADEDHRRKDLLKPRRRTYRPAPS